VKDVNFPRRLQKEKQRPNCITAHAQAHARVGNRNWRENITSFTSFESRTSPRKGLLPTKFSGYVLIDPDGGYPLGRDHTASLAAIDAARQ
jgi:hypothetical protein